jgi:hypothetical protein
MLQKNYAREHLAYRKLYNTVYGPAGADWAEPDWDALETYETARQGLSDALQEESDD